MSPARDLHLITVSPYDLARVSEEFCGRFLIDEQTVLCLSLSLASWTHTETDREVTSRDSLSPGANSYLRLITAASFVSSGHSLLTAFGEDFPTAGQA